MRNGQNKRMRGRNRSKGHHGHHNPLTRVYESNGPDVKIRGTAHHIAEKYLQLARDAMAGGDPVTAENYYQHAEHYFRLIAAAQEQLRQQNPYYQPQAGQGEPGRDDVIDEGDEDTGQPMQPQPAYQQQPYPPREQPQPYGGPQPAYQSRQPQPYAQVGQPPQPYQQPHRQPDVQPSPIEVSDGERLPSFITGAPQPQQTAAPAGQNGFEGQGAERYPRHRRRRHRGPRQDMPNMAQDLRGEEAPDDSRPDSA